MSQLKQETKTTTRELLLDSAFKTFYRYGYQGANIASILKDVGINKGSMYHFFKSKKDLALAVIEERIKRNLVNKYETILQNDKSVDVLFQTLYLAPEILFYGCPLNKMSQEMLYVDDDFKKLLSGVYVEFEKVIQKILEKEKIKNSEQLSRLIIATYEGALMSYHLTQNLKQYVEILESLKKKIV